MLTYGPQDAGLSAGLPVHWPLDPAPRPPWVGGFGAANAGAAVATVNRLANNTAIALRFIIHLLSFSKTKPAYLSVKR